MLPPSIDVLVPFWGMAGGVIKILDYADHAAQLGIATTLWAPPMPPADSPVHSQPALQRLLANDRVTLRPLDEFAIDANATVLFTEPTHHLLIERASPASLGARLVHLVQGTRHANPSWNDGLNYRLLHRPMTRIAVTAQVMAAISPLVDPRYPVHTIVEGHDCAYFENPTSTDPPGETNAPLRVLYATWKSDLGDRVAEAVNAKPAVDGRPIAFIAIRSTLGWPALRNRYRGADVLLCSPGPEEGFYLPGLEAMAAGLAVVTADVGGNAAYLRPDQNALVVGHDDVDAHVAAIERLRVEPLLRDRLIAGGFDTIGAHTLERERAEFGDVLAAIGT